MLTLRRGVVLSAVLLVVPLRTGTAALTGADILRRALDVRAGINDYTVEVKVHVDIPGTTFPDKTATVYFKRPDKLHVESRGGVLILPREAFSMTRLTKAVEENATIALAASRQTDRGTVHNVKIVPKDTSETHRVLVWVNGWNWTVQKMQLWDGQKPLLTMEWAHTKVAGKHWLPAKITARLEKGLGGLAPEGGSASMTLSNYRVNTGLPDELFEEDAAR